MKEFEKWFNENKVDWPYYPHDITDCELAWKATLEWVLGNYPDGVIYEIIKKELREK